jgi:aspartyl protease family protein
MVNSVGVVATAAMCAVIVGEVVMHASSLGRLNIQWTPADAPAPASRADLAVTSPARGATPTAAYVGKGKDGHFWAWAQIDGHPVRVLVDTGASTVALTPEDAKRAGVDLELLVYNRDVNTAQGVTHAAPVTLHHVSVAGAEIDGVEALVVPEGLSASLLGMSYLGRLESFEATRSGLFLRP